MVFGCVGIAEGDHQRLDPQSVARLSTVRLRQRGRRSILTGVLAMLALSQVAPGQVIGIGGNQSPPIPNVGNHYIQLLNETVNPVNGAVSVRISVPVPPSRGFTVPFTFGYDSNLAQPIESAGVSSDNGILFQGGWRYILPAITYSQGQSTWSDCASGEGDGGCYVYTCSYTNNYIFQDSQGSMHGFSGLITQQQQQINAAPGSYPIGFNDVTAKCAYPSYAPPYPLNWTTDGDPQFSAHLIGDFTYGYSGGVNVADNDGTVYSTSSGSGSVTIEDRNGNKAVVNGSNNVLITDTNGRTAVSMSGFGASGNTVRVAGLTTPYTVTWGTANANWTPASQIANSGYTECNGVGSIGNLSVITNLALPNGESYQFQYSDPVYGLLTKIIYPNGGYVQYDWGSTPIYDFVYYADYANDVPNACQARFSIPAIAHRYVSYDGSHVDEEQDFTYATPTWVSLNNSSEQYWSQKQTTVKTTDEDSGVISTTVYDYVPYNVSGDYLVQLPMEQSVIHKDGSGNVLETETIQHPNPYQLPSTTITTLSNGATSEHVISYSLPNGTSSMPQDVSDYDYGPNGSPGALLRHIHYDYHAFAGSPVDPDLSIIDRPDDVITYDGSAHRVAETDYVYDNGGLSVVSNLPQGTHDETSYGASVSSPRGNVTTVTTKCLYNCTADSGVTLAYDETGQVVSRIDSCGSPNSVCVDMTGANHKTIFSYTDNFTGDDGQPSGNTNAYLTQITDPLGHSKTFSYGFNDGKLRSMTDENDQTTTYCYVTGGCNGSTFDPWMRLTQVVYPDHGQTTASYVDGGSNPSISVAKLINSGPPEESTTIMDGMGHVVQMQLTSDPAGTVYADTLYDGGEQAYQQSNSTRCASSPGKMPSGCAEPTWGVTAFAYDSLGRKISQTQPDGTSVLRWCYDGLATSAWSSCPSNQSSPFPNDTWVNSQDEAGNLSQDVSDGLSRLVAVKEELPAGGSLGPETDYTYDALGNLLCVDQWGASTPRTLCSSSSGSLQRRFSYDSFSRLITSTNPETGTICYGQWSGGSVGSGTCQNGYDANGNLSYKTDARGLTTQYTYDALNRLVQKVTPVVSNTSGGATGYISTCYQYDTMSGVSGSPNLIGHLTAEWTQSGNTCASPFSAAVALTATIYLSYDPMGRPLLSQQCVKGGCQTGAFTQSQTYDLAGNMTSWQDGRGLMTFTQQFDSAGHPVSLTNSFSGGGFPSVLFSAQGYAPPGLLQNWNVGDYLNFTRSYDHRLRIAGETVVH